MAKSVLNEKSFDFAIRIVNLYKHLVDSKKKFVLSKQILMSGTAVGALITEGKYAESKADFIHKYGIALKECGETEYWLNLLYRTAYIDENEFNSMLNDNEELLRLLIASINTAKKNR